MITQEKIKSAGFMLQWQSDIFGPELKAESFVLTEEETAEKVAMLGLDAAFMKGYIRWVEIFTRDIDHGEEGN